MRKLVSYDKLVSYGKLASHDKLASYNNLASYDKYTEFFNAANNTIGRAAALCNIEFNNIVLKKRILYSIISVTVLVNIVLNYVYFYSVKHEENIILNIVLLH